MNYSTNYVKYAVERVGGPTRVANKLGVSSSTVHAWIKLQRVPNFDRAEALAGLAKIAVAKLREAQ